MSLSGKRVLLIVGGGIAAYKSLDLIRRVREHGGAVRCVLTAAGSRFVTPLSLAALSEDKVYQELFDLTDESEMGHIQLSRNAELVVVAPATADLMAKMATGRADDLASTVLLATDKPILVAPAMNVAMWHHRATVRNVATLAADGVTLVGPNEGAMACGEFGLGRMAEPAEILAAIEARLTTGDRPLAGLKALITSGPTHEPIDPVRYIANRSSGKQGHAVAAALAGLGAETRLVSGPTEQPDPAGVETVHVESAAEMLAACRAGLPADILVCAAAVADWRVVGVAEQKLKKPADGAPPTLEFRENPDILATLSQLEHGRPRLVVGFAAETEKLIENAMAKRRRKGCDWIVANSVAPGESAFQSDSNVVHLMVGDTVEDWPRMSKSDVADRLAARIAEHFREAAP